MSIVSSASTISGQVGSLPKQITDVTTNIANGAKSLDEMVDKMTNALKNAETHKPVSGAIVGGLTKLSGGLGNLTGKAVNATGKLKDVGGKVAKNLEALSTAANSIKQSAQDLQNCLDVVKTSSTLVNAVVDTYSRNFNPTAMGTALTNFDSGWDSWAKAVNGVFNKATSGEQANILATLAKEKFGDNVFYLGSAIKNESAGIFAGIGDFETAVNAFGGSYSNPIEAAKKIETSVKGIVNATEKVANSLNNMVKTMQLKGTEGTAAGNKVLSYLCNLHNTKVVAAVNKVLTVGGGAATLATDATALNSALQSKDSQAIYQAGKKTVEEDARTFIDSLKNKDTATQTTSLATSASSSGDAATGGAANATDSASENQSENQKDDNNDSGGADSYVCSRATMKCTFGDSSAKLSVYPDRTVFLTGQPMANISDHVSMYNIHPFGKCHTTSYPPTGSATAANHGSLTPMPCVPGTNSNWLNGKDDYIIKGNPALLKSSYCKCRYGGVITITDDGQTDTGKADLSKVQKSKF